MTTRYLATINTPGYLPMDDEPPIFDTPCEAWSYLADERTRAEDDTADDDSEAYSDTRETLCVLGTAAHWQSLGDDDTRTAEWLTSHGLAPDGTGAVYGDTPGYDGSHDLGEAYTVTAVDIGDLDTALRAYLVCALWSSTGDDGEPLDATLGPDDVAPESVTDARDTLADFMTAQREVIASAGIDAEQLGHDFWLTRNGHGAGFWDRGLGADGETLTRMCKPYGSSDAYIGDDGRVYLT